MAEGGGYLVAVMFGCIVGAGGYAMYARTEVPPAPSVVRAEIDYECFSNSNNYECSFFNRGRGQGAVCIKGSFVRGKEEDKYTSKYDFRRIEDIARAKAAVETTLRPYLGAPTFGEFLFPPELVRAIRRVGSVTATLK